MLPERLADAEQQTVKTLNELQSVVDAGLYDPVHREVSLSEIDFDQQGFVKVAGEELEYLQGVHELLAERAGIPKSFGYAIDFDLFRHTFNQMKRRSSAQNIVLSSINGKVVGVSKAPYRVARTKDLLHQISLREDRWEFESATIGDFGIKLNLLIPGAVIEPKRGDEIKIGLQLSNSETGGEALRSTVYSHRLVCSNGATVQKEDAVVYWKAITRQTYESSLRSFVRQMDRARDQAEAKAVVIYRNVLDRMMSDDRLLKVHRGLNMRLKRFMETPLNADKVLKITRDERLEIQKRIRERDPMTPPAPTKHKVFDLHNRITEEAQNHPLLLRSSLEEFGGQLLLAT